MAAILDGAIIAILTGHVGLLLRNPVHLGPLSREVWNLLKTLERDSCLPLTISIQEKFRDEIGAAQASTVEFTAGFVARMMEDAPNQTPPNFLTAIGEILKDTLASKSTEERRVMLKSEATLRLLAELISRQVLINAPLFLDALLDVSMKEEMGADARVLVGNLVVRLIDWSVPDSYESKLLSLMGSSLESFLNIAMAMGRQEISVRASDSMVSIIADHISSGNQRTVALECVVGSQSGIQFGRAALDVIVRQLQEGSDTYITVSFENNSDRKLSLFSA